MSDSITYQQHDQVPLAPFDAGSCLPVCAPTCQPPPPAQDPCRADSSCQCPCAPACEPRPSAQVDYNQRATAWSAEYVRQRPNRCLRPRSAVRPACASVSSCLSSRRSCSVRWRLFRLPCHWRPFDYILPMTTTTTTMRTILGQYLPSPPVAVSIKPLVRLLQFRRLLSHSCPVRVLP